MLVDAIEYLLVEFFYFEAEVIYDRRELLQRCLVRELCVKVGNRIEGVTERKVQIEIGST